MWYCLHLNDSHIYDATLLLMLSFEWWQFVAGHHSLSESFSLASFKCYWHRMNRILRSQKMFHQIRKKKFWHQLIVGYVKTLQNKLLLFPFRNWICFFISVFQLGRIGVANRFAASNQIIFYKNWLSKSGCVSNFSCFD